MTMYHKAFCLVCTALLFGLYSHAQQYDSVSVKNVQLDSFVVKSGFNMNSFIRRVQNDTTFYKAFKSMHLVPFSAVNSFTAYDKKGRVAASMHTNAQQRINAKRCRTTTFTNQTVTGDFYKKDKKTINYYTADLFYNLFYSDKPVCNQNDIVAGSMVLKDKSRMEKNKYELKQLIFNPGSKVEGVPFMGDKASIFDPGEVDKYDMKISQEMYDSEEVYVFNVTPKPEYKNKVVYNELKTWFRRSDYSILARDYSLSFNTIFYDFDVHMKVRMKMMGGKLYPTLIDYNGNWYVPTQGRERMKVLMDIVY